jgi:hypothetical protein
MKYVRARRIATILLGAAASASTMAAPAAADFIETFANHAGPLNSGQTFVNAGISRSTYTEIGGGSTGTAYTGVWISQFVNGVPVRSSADAYCSTPGCTASEIWTGPWPSGSPSIHNHGNASPSYFNGSDTFF